MAPSLYIHIPFCKRKCLYCSFYSNVYDNTEASSYIDTLIAQIKDIDIAPSTIYIGGGTPTALEKTLLVKLLKGLAGHLSGAEEFTIEANPESLDRECIKALIDSGVNRISIGLESLKDEKLKMLGRLHSVREGIDSVNLSARMGFKNISVDLIFGVWGESAESWKKELLEVVNLPATHISTYELTYESGTPLFNALRNKSVTPLEDEVAAGMYETAIDELSLRGFKQYEISSFAKSGYESKHNMNYWRLGEYIGLGPSAASYVGGVRSKNVSDTGNYIKRCDDKKNVVCLSESLTPARRAREAAAIKIRTKEGIDFAWFKEKTGFDFAELEKDALKDLFGQDLIKYKKNNGIPAGIILKRKGFLFCDTVSSALL